MKLSIVATLYQSAPYILEFYQRASAAARQLVDEDYEIVLVNDGSPDITLDLAVQLTKSDCNVIIIDLSRNFGHHKAMMTGLAHAKGERVLLIDSDLEEDPECLITFAEEMQSQHCDAVYGFQVRRKGNWFERWSGQWVYRLFKTLTGLALSESTVTARRNRPPPLLPRRRTNKHPKRNDFFPDSKNAFFMGPETGKKVYIRLNMAIEE